MKTIFGLTIILDDNNKQIRIYDHGICLHKFTKVRGKLKLTPMKLTWEEVWIACRDHCEYMEGMEKLSKEKGLGSSEVVAP